MSKTASPALFDLIHNMSKSEKRYFKIHASRHTIGEQNKYVQLFDFIEQQKEFNEEEVFAHFKGESFLNKFSITKNRLYDHLMKALAGFHSNSSSDANIYKLLHGAEILYEKGLYEHSDRQLKSAKRLALKNGDSALLLKIESKLNEIKETQGYAKVTLSELESQEKELNEILVSEKYYNKLWLLKSKLFSMMHLQGKSRSEEDIEKFEILFDEYEKLKRPEKISFNAQYLSIHFESAYYFATLNREKCLNSSYKNLELFQKENKKIKDVPHKYLSVLTNIIHLELAEGNTKSIYSLLGELNTFKVKYKISTNEDLEIKLFSSIKSTNLMVHIHQAEFQKAVSMEESIIEGFNQFGGGITPSRKAYLSFKLAIAFFGEEEFNNSLKWINAILNDSELDENEDIVAFAHIVGLIIHFELNNTSYLPYALKSTLRFLQNRKRSYSFETLFLKNLRKVINTDDPFKAEELLQDVAYQLEEVAKDPFQSVAFEYFDFRSWLISKIKKKKFQVVKRDAYLTQSA